MNAAYQLLGELIAAAGDVDTYGDVSAKHARITVPTRADVVRVAEKLGLSHTEGSMIFARWGVRDGVRVTVMSMGRDVE